MLHNRGWRLFGWCIATTLQHKGMKWAHSLVTLVCTQWFSCSFLQKYPFLSLNIFAIVLWTISYYWHSYSKDVTPPHSTHTHTHNQHRHTNTVYHATFCSTLMLLIKKVTKLMTSTSLDQNLSASRLIWFDLNSPKFPVRKLIMTPVTPWPIESEITWAVLW